MTPPDDVTPRIDDIERWLTVKGRDPDGFDWSNETVGQLLDLMREQQRSLDIFVRANRHPITGRWLTFDCETDCQEHCAGLCGVKS